MRGYKQCMKRNSVIPNGWSMPEEQADRVKDQLNRKSLNPEDALQKGLAEIARDIAIIEPDPEDWAWWISYLLEQMQTEAENRGKISAYQQMIKKIEY